MSFAFSTTTFPLEIPRVLSQLANSILKGNIMNIFEIASREDYRFNSVVGLISVSDLWKLPLTSSNEHKPNLNSIAIAISKSLKEFTEETWIWKVQCFADLCNLHI